MKSTFLALITGLVFFGSGCIVDHHNHSCAGSGCNVPLGDITFDWAFQDGANVYTCTDPYVDVRNVHIEISYYDAYYGEYYPEYEIDRPCQELVATITNFIPGGYRIYVEGRSGYDSYLFFDTLDVTVNAGPNDYGTLYLQ
jgi:hypothetical protein